MGQLTREELEAADERRRRRVRGSLTFRGVAEALEWYVRARELLQGAHALWPRTEAYGGRWTWDASRRRYVRVDAQQTRVCVDGGRGGDLDEVLATVQAIGDLLGRVGLEQPGARRGRPPAIPRARWPWVLEEVYGHGRPVQELARVLQVDRGTVGETVGRAEAAFGRLLRDAGVVV